MEKTTPVSTRTDVLLQEIRGRIVRGELQPGAKLPSEAQLVADHGVSRTVVREVMTHLQAEGLVTTRRGSGSFVLTPPPEGGSALSSGGGFSASTPQERAMVMEFRVAIESEGAGLAAARANRVLVEAVVDAEQRFATESTDPATARPSQLLGLDFDFHRAVAVASGNALLLQAVDSLGPAMIAMPPERLEVGADDDAARRFMLVRAEHAAIAAAIADQDVQGAMAAMRTHLHSSARRWSDQSTG